MMVPSGIDIRHSMAMVCGDVPRSLPIGSQGRVS
jgi:hypothetical protein